MTTYVTSLIAPEVLVKIVMSAQPVVLEVQSCSRSRCDVSLYLDLVPPYSIQVSLL